MVVGDGGEKIQLTGGTTITIKTRDTFDNYLMGSVLKLEAFAQNDYKFVRWKVENADEENTDYILIPTEKNISISEK